MRFTETLLAMIAILLVSSHLVTAASPATKNGATPTTKLAPGLYAEFYRVENGVVSDKMQVPLGDVDKDSDAAFKTDTEERAAPYLPSFLTSRPLRSAKKGLEKFMTKNLFSFGVPSAVLHFSLEGEAQRVKVKIPRLEDAKSGKAHELPLFRDDENIRGVLTVKVDSNKRLEHTGLKLELLGLIEVPVDRSAGYEFTNSLRELQPSGEVIDGEESFTFDFSKVDKPHESYYGRSVKLRYVLRATLARGNYASNLVHEQDLWVQRVAPPPPVDRSIKMEVGIEDCLHIEFEYDKSRYHLKDVVIGKIFFLLVRIKIKHMELAILRRESVGAGTQRHSESETITKFEIMDGAPVKGESVPVRLYLSPYALTPTYRNVQSRFSVKYFLNLVLVDEEDRRYFKQQEITLWRKTIG